MIHIVSGYFRSGTSAMMRALIAGGMSAAWSEERNQLADAHADGGYHPNKDGLYEIRPKEYSDLNFPLAHQGKLIKAFLPLRLATNPDGYRLIVMRRDPAAIRLSMEAFFRRDMPDIPLAQYERFLQSQERKLVRPDVQSLTFVQFEDLIESPVRELQKLLDDGWEFELDAAASAIDPSLCRCGVFV